MTDDLIALARRAVACPKWRLMPGMLTDEGRRVMQVWPDNLGIKWSHLLDNRVVRDADALPDLTDAATIGCLLALVRVAWSDECAYMMPQSMSGGGGWYFWACPPGDGNSPRGVGQTEAEAMVAALESAP